MITTPDLIESLARDAAPVRRLRPPVVRAATWLAFAAVMLALVASVHGVRPDFAASLRQSAFAIDLSAALATGVLAAIGAFILSIPGRSRAWLLLPVPALAVWVMNIGYDCFTAWVDLPPGMKVADEASCFALLVMTSVPLSLVMLIMLRHAALIVPTAVALMGSLAVAGLSAVALTLFHAHEASALVLIWNLGIATLLAVLGGVAGRSVFSWVSPR